MGFTSALPPYFLAANKVVSKLNRGPFKRPLPPWDPTLCSATEQDAIKLAFSTLAITYIPAIEAIGYDWKKLADLMKTQTVNSLSITCEGLQGNPNISSNARDKTLNVNLDTSRTTMLDAWLLVAVIHLCGGTDLDAWAIKNWLFSVSRTSSGTTYYPLLASEKMLMCAGSTPVPPDNWRAGQFTVWANMTGELWPSNRAAANKYSPVPAGGFPVIPPGTTYWQSAC
jgi:hypothetical protein